MTEYFDKKIVTWQKVLSQSFNDLFCINLRWISPVGRKLPVSVVDSGEYRDWPLPALLAVVQKVEDGGNLDLFAVALPNVVGVDPAKVEVEIDQNKS